MKIVRGIGSLPLVALLSAGCATHRTTRVERDAQTGDTVRTEETTTDTSEPDCAGVLSCTVDVVGEVIAFPFRVTAGAIDAIF